MRYEYKGYTIKSDHGHYVVTGPDGTWTADTETEAEQDIDELDEDNK